MKLEQQVCHLSYAKTLKELGIKQDSLLYWNEIKGQEPLLSCTDVNRNFKNNNVATCSAFTATELLELLPGRITLKENEPFNSFRTRIQKSFIVDESKQIDEILKLNNCSVTDIYSINYHCDSTEVSGENAWLDRRLFEHNIWDQDICNALAKTLIVLIDKEYIILK